MSKFLSSKSNSGRPSASDDEEWITYRIPHDMARQLASLMAKRQLAYEAFHALLQLIRDPKEDIQLLAILASIREEDAFKADLLLAFVEALHAETRRVAKGATCVMSLEMDFAELMLQVELGNKPRTSGKAGGNGRGSKWRKVAAYAVELAKNHPAARAGRAAAFIAKEIEPDVRAFAKANSQGFVKDGDSARQIAIWLREAGVKKAPNRKTR